MLNEYKKIYEDYAKANLPEGWKKLDINEIWRNCNNDADSPWFSALVVRYWSSMEKIYAQSRPFFNETDAYSWFIDALLYTIRKHVWDVEGSRLYNDPKGPDKAFHVGIKCGRLTAFQQANTDKRKANATYYSTEDYSDFVDLDDDTSTTMNESFVDDAVEYYNYDSKIIQLYEKKDYFQAFLLDGIINYNMNQDIDEDGFSEFNPKELAKFLKNLNPFNVEQFASNYGFKKEDVESNIHYITDLSFKDILERINRMLFIYRKIDFINQ